MRGKNSKLVPSRDGSDLGDPNHPIVHPAISPGSNGVNGGSWELPNSEKQGKCSQTRRFALKIDAAPQKPQRQTSSHSIPLENMKQKRREKLEGICSEDTHPDFTNMVISFERQDSFGDLTFDGSVAYDQNYQHQLQKRQQLFSARKAAEMEYTLPRGASGGAKTSNGVRHCPSRKYPRRQAISKPHDDCSANNELLDLDELCDDGDDDILSANHEEQYGVDKGSFSSPTRNSKSDIELRKMAFQQLEVLQTESPRDHFSMHGLSPTQQMNSNDDGSQDSELLAALEQEREMIELAMERSLGDFSSGSSFSGYSLPSVTSNNDYSSINSSMAVRRYHRYSPTRRAYGSMGANGSNADLQGAGCHLAMIASRGNSAPGRMLHAIEDDSDEDVASVPGFAGSPPVQAAFVWKKDSRTNRWYKKPIPANIAPGLSEEEKLLEEVKERSVKEAMATSFEELRQIAFVRSEIV
jgi:hypothetical protein